MKMLPFQHPTQIMERIREIDLLLTGLSALVGNNPSPVATAYLDELLEERHMLTNYLDEYDQSDGWPAAAVFVRID